MHVFVLSGNAVLPLKVLDNGIIKQLKIQRPTYNKTPPLETMGGVFVCKVRHGLTIGQPRSPLDIFEVLTKPIKTTKGEDEKVKKERLPALTQTFYHPLQV